MKRFLRLCLPILLLCFAGAGWVCHQARVFLTSPPESPGREILFDVKPGAPLKTVARLLEEKGLVTDARRFELLARWKKYQNRLQAGRFALNTGWTPARVLDALVNGMPLLFRVTVPEGLTWWQTGRLLENAGFVEFSDFRAVVTDGNFLRHYGIPFASAEGFLMPDTYLLKKPGIPGDVAAVPGALAGLAVTPGRRQAIAVAGRMVDNFWRRAGEVWPGRKKPAGEDLEKWVILASVVEKETSIGDERPRVAGVYANRLARRMLLQADPTVIYGLGAAFDGNLRRRHLEDANNPYNTYQRGGLPPGPICSFGMDALAAAVNPEKHDFLYFVAKTDGGEHVFSTNLADHNRAVRRYLQTRARRRALPGHNREVP